MAQAGARDNAAAELKALGDYAADLYVQCNEARWAVTPPTNLDELPLLLRKVVAATGKALRRSIEAGRVMQTATLLCSPDFECCCAQRFVARAERHLTPDQVRYLRSLATDLPDNDEPT